MLGPKLWRYLKGSDTGPASVSELDKLAPLAFGSSNDAFLRMLAGEDGSFSAEGTKV